MVNVVKSKTLSEDKNRWATTWLAFNDARKLYGRDFVLDVCAEPCTTKCDQFIIAQERYDELIVDELVSDGDCISCDGKTIFGINALAVDWLNHWWCNPPFDEKKAFIEKAVQQDFKGNHGLMMLPYEPLTKWWMECVEPFAAKIFEPDGRYNFLMADGVTAKNSVNFGSAFVLFDCTQKAVPRQRFKRGHSLIEIDTPICLSCSNGMEEE